MNAAGHVRCTRELARGFDSVKDCLFHRGWQVHNGKHVRRKQVVFARFVNHAKHAVVLSVRVIDHFVQLAKLERREVSSVPDADGESSMLTHVS